MKSLLGQKLLVHAGNASWRQQQCHEPLSSSNLHGGRQQKQPVVLLACSAAGQTMSPKHTQIFNSRRLCEDRKGPVDHLYPSRFAKSTLKLAMMQGMHVMSGYMNDQLKEDMERDELVDNKLMTRQQAEKEADEWSEREWKKRWEAFPKQLAISFAKFHAVVLVTRLYEHVAERWVTQITLDKLTMDTFECAKRQSRQGKTGPELGREMLGTCWNANLISFLADYSVHQVIMLFGYYVYMNETRRQRRQQRLVREQQGGEEKDQASDESEEDTASDDDTMGSSGPLVLSAVRKSTLLAISRAVALSFTAVGGAVGSIMWPGWGTLAGSNMGDSIAATLTEDLAPVVVA